jgi:hypothetical protein
MKNTLLIFCLCLIAGSVNAWDDTKYDTLITKWPNGNIEQYTTRVSFLGNEKGFLPHGISRTFHENGQLESEGHYKYSDKVGAWNYWDEAGNRMRDLNYFNGRLEGAYYEWHSDNSVKISGYYANGLRNGLWIFRRIGDEFNNSELAIDSIQFYVNGDLLVDLEGHNGEWLHKEKKWYNPELDLWVTWERRNVTDYLGTYQSFSTGSMVDGLKQGRWVTRAPDGGHIDVQFFDKGIVVNPE